MVVNYEESYLGIPIRKLGMPKFLVGMPKFWIVFYHLL